MINLNEDDSSTWWTPDEGTTFKNGQPLSERLCVGKDDYRTKAAHFYTDMRDQIIEVNDPKMGRLSIRLWCNLHFQQSQDHSLNLIQIQRLDESGVSKIKPLWLAWVGLEMPALSSFWQLYCRRFAIDHWYRFAKQRLHMICLN